MQLLGFRKSLLASVIAMAGIAGCGEGPSGEQVAEPSQQQVSVAENGAEALASKFSYFLEQSYQQSLDRSPTTKESRGAEGVFDSWDNLSESFADESLALTEQQLTQLKATVDREQLSEENQLSYDLFVYEAEMALEGAKYRDYGYPVNQMYGMQTMPIGHLINIHEITNRAAAEAYIARLKGLKDFLAQVQESLVRSASKGIVAPKFALEGPAAQIDGLLSGKPFQADAESDNLFLSTFKTKLAETDLDEAAQAELVVAAEKVLLESVAPAYQALQAQLVELAKKAEVKGVWALPGGADYYRHQLKNYTTTDMTPEEIHQLGWSEVRRIHTEIKAIMDQVGFKGDLKDFFKYTAEDDKFFYDKSEAGRAQAIADAKRFIEGFEARLDEAFITQPKAGVEVKAVEAYREATSPVAFYNPGTPDGSRPGIYYLNLYNPKEMPTWQMAPIAYHEGIPGHHMQISIAQEQEGLPSFRKFLYYSAYGEGWGLYSEYLPKEMGFYTDPMDDYGRLIMELLRACRLVADSGVHYKQWDEETAIQFMLDNMPINRERATRSVRRYFVMPGQATAYKVGQLKILELREAAKEQLGDAFDIGEFHEVVLTSSAVPLTILEKRVADWVASKR